MSLAAMLALGVAAAPVLGGCASTVADLPIVGAPANLPARPARPGEYLPIHDMPAARDTSALAPSDQAKLEAELIAARDRQAVAAPAAIAPAKTPAR